MKRNSVKVFLLIVAKLQYRVEQARIKTLNLSTLPYLYILKAATYRKYA